MLQVNRPNIIRYLISRDIRYRIIFGIQQRRIKSRSPLIFEGRPKRADYSTSCNLTLARFAAVSVASRGKTCRPRRNRGIGGAGQSSRETFNELAWTVVFVLHFAQRRRGRCIFDESPRNGRRKVGWDEIVVRRNTEKNRYLNSLGYARKMKSQRWISNVEFVWRI